MLPPTPAVRGIGGVVDSVIDTGSLACFNTLLSAEETFEEIMRSNRKLVPSDVLDQGVIFFVEPIEDEVGEFRVMERLPNGGQCISKRLHFVLEGLGGEVTLLDLAKLVTDGHCVRTRLHGEAGLSRVAETSRAVAAKTAIPAIDDVRED
jgi:hypothetical protein